MKKACDLYLYSCEEYGEEVFEATSRQEAKKYIKAKVDADSCKYVDKNLQKLSKSTLENIKRNMKIITDHEKH